MPRTRMIPTMCCALVSATFACGAAVAGAPGVGRIAIDAAPHFSDFMVAHGRVEAIAQSKPALSNINVTPLPSVSVYSPAGDLIYDGGGDVREKNFAILQGLPESVEHLAPVSGRPKLAAMLGIVPEFQARQAEILADRHYVVYAVTFSQGQVSHTEKEVAAVRAREATLPVDTLLVKMQQ